MKQKIILAFSGGDDSTFLLEVIYRYTNRICHAVFFQTPFVSPKTLDRVYKYLEKKGINFTIIPIDLLEDPSIVVNQSDRCYYCKKFMFEELMSHFNFPGENPRFFEGTNFEEAMNEHRPGLAAIEELGLESPLRRAGLTAEDIAILRKEYSIPEGVDHIGCLATRIPYDTPITMEILEKVDKAEDFLRERDFHNVRVRYFGEMARIEVKADEIGRLGQEEIRVPFLKHMEDLGFSKILVDLRGYRKGSLDLESKKT
ncbi:MAG: ATP-dependent sacrificial sulfur transferase LarE [Deltaproteobacteria bacterium]|nr:ATP-dependent sacrificial sulfur transferase LarE [Deltaproteobacteria bacterium]